MQASRDRQKSYADLKRKPMEFQVGDKVILKVFPWKGVVRFGKWGKLNPKYVGPFKVLERVGDVAYKLDLSEELSRVHNTFHVSNLNNCHADEPLAVPLDGLHFNGKLYFVEEPVEIVDREVKRLKRSQIQLVKVRWNSKRGPEVYNRRTKKIIETMNVSFDELFAMDFEQRSSKPRLQSMTSGHISSGLDLTYAPLTITTQQPSEGELDLLFEAMYDDYIGGQPSATTGTVLPAQEPQVRQSSTASTTIADTTPITTNSSSLATNIPITSHDVDELNPNAMVDGNTFVNPFANSSTSTKDHPLEQVIGEPSRPDLTRNQLRYDGDMCMYALTVSTMEPKNVKEAMTDLAWIDSMQEELLSLKGLMYEYVDYARCKDTFKSTSGGAQFLGEKLVSWSSKKQDCTTLSTMEAEYVSLSACCAQVFWMRTQLTDYGFHFNNIPIYCDSKSAIAISCNPVQHSRTKHIAVRYYFIKEHVEKGTIELYFFKTDYQLADIFIKALLTDRFNYLVRRLARAEGIYPGTLPLDKVEVL
nr:putative reverse transcriptase domain-containing protein [Tanacetum cinerariifolium]